MINFLTVMESIPDGTPLYHQTLTFCPPTTDLAYTKKLLNMLLGNLHKQFRSMGSVYTRELHETGALHYQLLFFHFDLTYSEMEDFRLEFGRKVFGAWNNLQNERLIRQANQIKIYKKNFETTRYITKAVEVNPLAASLTRQVSVIPVMKREPAIWWGRRPKKVFDKYTSLPDRQEVLRQFKWKYTDVVLKTNPLTSTQRSRRYREMKSIRLPFQSESD